MGNWRITIEGHGQHHNNKLADAEEIARGFVPQLTSNGHQVERARFELVRSTGANIDERIYGGPEDLTQPRPKPAQEPAP